MMQFKRTHRNAESALLRAETEIVAARLLIEFGGFLNRLDGLARSITRLALARSVAISGMTWMNQEHCEMS
jgi:hypothetical protein